MKYKITTNNVNVDFNILKCLRFCRRTCVNKTVLAICHPALLCLFSFKCIKLLFQFIILLTTSLLSCNVYASLHFSFLFVKIKN